MLVVTLLASVRPYPQLSESGAKPWGEGAWPGPDRVV